MRQVVDGAGRRLLGYVNVHSGEWALYTPWDSKPAYGSGLPADMPDLVATVGRVCGCKVGPAGAVSGYLAFGSSMDYLYVARRVPYPLTVEVYGGGGVGKLQPGEGLGGGRWDGCWLIGLHVRAVGKLQPGAWLGGRHGPQPGRWLGGWARRAGWRVQVE
eukprot:GHRQ01038933.1.p1 GENE.GHRQ01038933.1~~GHRQ01038933.1.p1  ORF type:complete len:160 (+),score=47.11 GHRQ01038933.1:312-791(+)